MERKTGQRQKKEEMLFKRYQTAAFSSDIIYSPANPKYIRAAGQECKNKTRWPNIWSNVNKKVISSRLNECVLPLLPLACLIYQNKQSPTHAQAHNGCRIHVHLVSKVNGMQMMQKRPESKTDLNTLLHNELLFIEIQTGAQENILASFESVNETPNISGWRKIKNKSGWKKLFLLLKIIISKGWISSFIQTKILLTFSLLKKVNQTERTVHKNHYNQVRVLNLNIRWLHWSHVDEC